MADPRQEWKTRTGVNEFRKRPSRSPSPERPLATTQHQASGPPPKNVGGPPTFVGRGAVVSCWVVAKGFSGVCP